MLPNRSRRRSAFTLVELLVVIALLATLLGLLVPAVQRVREAASNVRCLNNLKQIGLAAHSYENAYGWLPPGLDVNCNGPLVFLLPYLDQGAVFQNYSFAAPPNPPQGPATGWFRDPLNRPPTTDQATYPPPTSPAGVVNPTGVYGAQPEIQTYLCPSAKAPNECASVTLCQTGVTPDVDFPASVGLGSLTLPASRNPGAFVVGRSNYAAVGGFGDKNNALGAFPSAAVAQGYDGLFTYISKTRLVRVADGTSSTLMFVEVSGGYSTITTVASRDHPSITISGWFDYSWPGAWVLSGFGTCPDPANSNLHGGHCDYASGQGFGLAEGLPGSFHANGRFNVVYADGSVRSLPGTIGTDGTGLLNPLWLALCGYHDGEIVEVD